MKVYRRKIVGGFFGNIFTKIIENVPGIARDVAPIAFDTSKAVDEKLVKGQKPTINQVISEIAPTAETKRAMITATKTFIAAR